MNMPGFTAEASLEPPGNRYNMTGDLSRLRRGETIIPQLPRILDCFCFRSMRYCCCRGADGQWTCGASMQA